MTSEERPAQKRQRIAKLMARAGLCSRRDAEAWILDGRVSVNGTVLTSPAMDVSEDDRVLVDDVPLPTPEKTRLFLFHKPRGLVTSDHDPEGRPTVADYLREHWPEGPRTVTIGRLDINTEGLLLLTNDGGLARTLELPQTGWVRRYRVRAKGTADIAALDALAHGITIDGIDYAGIEAKLDRTQGANVWLTMGLREGKNREIKRVLEHLGLEVNRLIRLSFGPFQLLNLEEGAVEEVKTRVLRDQLGEKLAAQAGVDLEGAAPAPAARDERTNKGSAARDKPAAGRDRPERGARPAGRGDSRTPGRSSARADVREETPVRERPVAGTRKHVSTLRASELEAARKGPRRRIERTDTRDRRDRTVTVERLVSTRPAPLAAAGRPPRRRPDADTRPRGTRERSETRRRAPDAATRAPRRESAVRDRPDRNDGRHEGRGTNAKPRSSQPRGARNDEPRDRHDAARGGARHASPSALGKRERMARSGATVRDQDRGPRDGRDDRRSPRDATVRTGRPDKKRQDRERQDRERATPHVDRRPTRDAKPPRPDRTGPREDRRAGRGGGALRASPGAGQRTDTERSKPPRPAGERHDTRDNDKPARKSRPMGAASRKPNSRKGPSVGGAGRPSGGKPGRPPSPRGPAKPKR